MSSLAEALKKWHDHITKHLYIGFAHWDDLVARIEEEERKPSSCCAREQVWTFAVACGYAAAGEHGVLMLTERLTGSRQKGPASPMIWFECLPIPVREREGATHVDLALGTFARREGTESGVDLEDTDSPWLCFCEMKWLSDISSHVTYDLHRSQLARVIENAVCFRGAERYAKKVYVDLVTPAIFREAEHKSRLYQYKFEDYSLDTGSLLGDLTACVLEQKYPCDLAERIQSLSLRWMTYDDLFAHLPDSEIRPELKNFWGLHGDYQGRALLCKET